MSRCMNSNNPQMTKGLFCQIPFSFSKNNPLSWDPQIKICRTKSHLDITLWYVFSSQHRLCFLGISFAKSSLNCHCRWQLNFFLGGNQNRFPGDSWLCILFGTTALAVPHLDPDGRCFWLREGGELQELTVCGLKIWSWCMYFFPGCVFLLFGFNGYIYNILDILDIWYETDVTYSFLCTVFGTKLPSCQ